MKTLTKKNSRQKYLDEIVVGIGFFRDNINTLKMAIKYLEENQ